MTGGGWRRNARGGVPLLTSPILRRVVRAQLTRAGPGVRRWPPWQPTQIPRPLRPSMRHGSTQVELPAGVWVPCPQGVVIAPAFGILLSKLCTARDLARSRRLASLWTSAASVLDSLAGVFFGLRSGPLRPQIRAASWAPRGGLRRLHRLCSSFSVAPSTPHRSSWRLGRRLAEVLEHRR